MLLILHGSSDVARVALANLLVKKRPAWRHLSIEDLGGLTEALGIDLHSNAEIGAMILGESIKTLHEEGMHVVQSMHDGSELLLQLPEATDGYHCRVLLSQEDSDGGEYHVIAEAEGRSPQKVLDDLMPLIEEMEKTSS